jgi:CobQ-like glutamine amidotransferase family enzyme
MFFRDSGRKDVIGELQSCQDLGKTYYTASGDVFKNVGILRAKDVYWNKERLERMSMRFSMSVW